MARRDLHRVEDFDETRTMHTKSNNVGIMIGSETDEIIKINERK